MGGDGSRHWDVRGSYLGCGPWGRMGRGQGVRAVSAQPAVVARGGQMGGGNPGRSLAGVTERGDFWGEDQDVMGP